MNKILKLLEEDARLSMEELAAMTGQTAEEVAAEVDRLQKDGAILAYRAVVDWDAAGSDMVESFVDIKISPKKGFGFDEFGEMAANMPEVRSCYLMSGGSDIFLVVRGRSFKEIAMFVGKRLAPMDSVISTATRFVLRTYKKEGVLIDASARDERELYI